MPTISVIICNYNYGEFITQSIQSVLNQTHNDFELIIVDDGSNDNSIDIINSFNDNRIIKVFQKNSGQAAAFNSGYLKATGEVISFLDSDDWWKKNKLKNIARWHEHLAGKYSILQHGITVWDNGNTIPYKLILPSGNCFLEMLTTEKIDFFVPTSGVSIPKTVADKVFPIPEALKICADAYLTRAAMIFGNVYSDPKSYGYYRKHQNTVYRNKTFALEKFLHEQLFPLLSQFYQKNNINDLLFKKKIARYQSMTNRLKRSKISRKTLSFLLKGK